MRSFSTDWRAAQSGFASLPLEKRVMIMTVSGLGYEKPLVGAE